METLGIAVLLHEQEHRAPAGHPETSSRLVPAVAWLTGEDLPFVRKPVPIESASDESIHAVHSPEFVRYLRVIAQAGGGEIDADTYVTPSSLEAARSVCGTLSAAARLSCTDECARSLVMGRPPGHHADRGLAMGFCLLNQVAVAAEQVLRDGLAKRVSIVDFDLHHGNGTQAIFYDRAEVQYLSTHQYPYYPGTGAVSERGIGDGAGYTVNIPLAAGSGDRELGEAFLSVITPAIEQFGPDLILVSAGFDGHAADPLGGLRFTAAGFEAVARCIRRLADRVCAGRVVTCVEGGYNPEANRDSLISYVKGLVTQ